MTKNDALKVTVALAILSLMPITACAKGNRGDDRRHGPPPEAIEACEGKEVGDSVEFTGRRGETLKATCREINGQMAAVPERMSPGSGPPK